MNGARDLSCGRVRAALRLERAGLGERAISTRSGPPANTVSAPFLWLNRAASRPSVGDPVLVR
jgi:hypothetical protein